VPEPSGGPTATPTPGESSIGIWLGRRANKAAHIAEGSCIGPIMNVKLVMARNGIDATVFVVPNKIAGQVLRARRSHSNCRSGLMHKTCEILGYTPEQLVIAGWEI
jgi:hypothetical protein